MYKIMVHIKNHNEFIDSDVCVEIELPAVPRKGDILFLNEEQIQILENKAKSNLEIAQNYAPKWFYYGSSGCKEPNENNLKDLKFEDAIYVDRVAFNGNSEIIHIELDDNEL
jgi:hypothetical protein